MTTDREDIAGGGYYIPPNIAREIHDQAKPFVEGIVAALVKFNEFNIKKGEKKRNEGR